MLTSGTGGGSRPASPIATFPPNECASNPRPSRNRTGRRTAQRPGEDVGLRSERKAFGGAERRVTVARAVDAEHRKPMARRYRHERRVGMRMGDEVPEFMPAPCRATRVARTGAAGAASNADTCSPRIPPENDPTARRARSGSTSRLIGPVCMDTALLHLTGSGYDRWDEPMGCPTRLSA